MKKKLIALLTTLTALFTLGACSTAQSDASSKPPSYGESTDGSTDNTDSKDESTDGSDESTDDSDNTDGGSDTDSSSSGDVGDYKYTDFNKNEKNLFNQYFGFVIPFLPNNNGYTVQDMSDSESGHALYFSGPRVEKEELDGYLGLYSTANGYKSQGKYIYGDTLYYSFSKNDVQIIIQVQESAIGYYVSVMLTEATDIDSTIPDKGEGPYYDFMDHEKAWYEEYCGFVIPFIYNEEYTVIPTIDYDNQIRFQTVVYDSNAVEEYLDLYYANYEFISSEEDEYESKTWYYFAKDDVTMSVCLSDYNDGTLIEVATSKAINYAYTDFTDEEKALYEDYCGFVIPFVANNNYSVVDNTADGEGLTFNVYVQPQAALQTYLNLYIYNDDYDMGFGHEENGVSFMDFSRGNFTLEMRWVFFTNGAEFSVTVKEREEPAVYIDFTDEEKALYQDYCGFVIPFYTNKGYTVTDNTEDGAGILFKLMTNISEKSAGEYLLNFMDQTKFEFKGHAPYDGKGAIYKFAKDGYTIFVILEAPTYSIFYVSVQVVEGDLAIPDYLYTDFKAGEKEAYQNAFGFVIPFAPNNYYSVDDFSATGGIKYLYFSSLLYN